jgi:RNA polymerase sigma-70 factor (ECF subfamily)
MAGQPGTLNLGELLRQASEGNEDAWRRLVEGYSVRVYGLLLRQCEDRELAEEITQATFVKIFRSLGDYQEQGRFEAWLFRIAINLLRDEIRRRRRQAKPLGLSGLDSEQDDAGSAALARASADEAEQSPLERVSRNEQLEALRQTVAQLGEADREVLYLRHTAGLSFPQIAEALDQPLGTVLARAHRALGKLRKLMANQE